jgi:hypothetical protein
MIVLCYLAPAKAGVQGDAAQEPVATRSAFAKMTG